MNALKKLTTAVAFASLSIVGTAALAQSPAAQGTEDGPKTKLGTEGHSMTGKGATGDTSQATGQSNTMQHGATGREAEGGHGMDYDEADRRSGGEGGSSGSSGSPTGSAGGAGNADRDSDPMSAPGHSAKDQGGTDPARSADRPGVTGASDPVERSQRDVDDSN